MLVVISALLPIAAILALGKVTANLRLLTTEGWIGLEKVTYFILFPALIISKLAVADFSNVDWRMPVALVGAQLALAGISIATGFMIKTPRNRIGVYVQSAARWNTFIALALAQELMGPTGLALVAVAAAAMIPVANLVSVSALMNYADEQVSLWQLLQKLAINPLVLACIIGLALNLIGLPLPDSLWDILDLLAQATIALGLLTTGAAIQVKGGSAALATVLSWSTLRLLGLPALAWTIAIGLGISSEILLVILIATGVPTASNGTILARQLGADANLAANLIAAQTVLSILTISALLFVSGLVT